MEPQAPQAKNMKQKTRNKTPRPGTRKRDTKSKKQETGSKKQHTRKGDRTPKQETINRTPNAKKVSLWLPRSFWKQTLCVFIGLRLLETFLSFFPRLLKKQMPSENVCVLETLAGAEALCLHSQFSPQPLFAPEVAPGNLPVIRQELFWMAAE